MQQEWWQWKATLRSVHEIQSASITSSAQIRLIKDGLLGQRIPDSDGNVYHNRYTNQLDPKLRTYLWRTKMASGGIDPWPHKFWPSVEFLKVYVQKTLRQKYYSSTLPRLLTPFTEKRWNEFYSSMAYQKKPLQPSWCYIEIQKYKSVPRMETQTTSTLLQVYCKETH